MAAPAKRRKAQAAGLPPARMQERLTQAVDRVVRGYELTLPNIRGREAEALTSSALMFAPRLVDRYCNSVGELAAHTRTEGADWWGLFTRELGLVRAAAGVDLSDRTAAAAFMLGAILSKTPLQTRQAFDAVGDRAQRRFYEAVGRKGARRRVEHGAETAEAILSMRDGAIAKGYDEASANRKAAERHGVTVDWVRTLHRKREKQTALRLSPPPVASISKKRD